MANSRIGHSSVVNGRIHSTTIQPSSSSYHHVPLESTFNHLQQQQQQQPFHIHDHEIPSSHEGKGGIRPSHHLSMFSSIHSQLQHQHPPHIYDHDHEYYHRLRIRKERDPSFTFIFNIIPSNQNPTIIIIIAAALLLFIIITIL